MKMIELGKKKVANEELPLSGLEQSLSLGLKAIAVITLFNIAIIYWLPMQLPLSSFAAVKMMFMAFGEGQYYLIPFSVLSCVLLFVGGIKVQKRRILVPVITAFYLLYDLIELMLVAASDYLANNGYFRSDLAGLLLTTIVEILMFIYCSLYWNKNLELKRRVVVHLIFWFFVTCCFLVALSQCINLLTA